MRHVLILLCLVLTLPVFAGLPCEPVANYDIQAQLNPAEKTITGSLVLEWTNTSSKPVSDLWFHAYLNAFRNTNSSFLQEGLNDPAPLTLFGSNWPDDGWGSLQIKSLAQDTDNGPIDLLPTLAYMHPDDDNAADMTVFKVDLPTAVPAKGVIRVRIEFISKLPYKGIRAAFKESFFMAGQWFPKIGVLTEAGWNCHQYHRTSEFFSDFGGYRVKLTVPKGFVVGATGVLTDSTASADHVEYTFAQECIHDFAFTACPEYRVKTQTFEQNGSPVTIRLLYLPGHERWVERYFKAAEHGLLHFGEWYLPYPYPQLTIVDVPGDTWTGSMEYPTLITVRNDLNVPDGNRAPEWTVIHELGHQFWYGIVASNEMENPWLDEGLVSYADVRCINASYGYLNYGYTWLERPGFGLPMTFGNIEYNPAINRVNRLRAADTFAPVDLASWQYADHSSYKGHVYDKAALLLMTLENTLGAETFNAILKEYAHRYQFKHPVPNDLVNLINEMSPVDVSDLLEQVLHGHDQLDYAVQSVTSTPVAPARGLDKSGKLYKSAGKDTKAYRSDIMIKRNGGLVIPVDIRVEFENGETETLTWDGHDGYKRIVYTHESPVLKVVVDPEQKVMLDMDPSNNTRYRHGASYPAVKWSARWFFWFQHLLETAASFS